MITNVLIENFRSIEKADIKLAPITVLCGPTAAGKSTFLYATQILRNFILQPNRQPEGYFNLGFMDLAGFDACVFDHQHQNRQISIAVTHERENTKSTYGLTFGKTEGTIRLNTGTIDIQAKVAIPYGVNQSFPFPHKDKDDEYSINWNGLAVTVAPKLPTPETQKYAQNLAIFLNADTELIKGIDIAPHRRGFFKPFYTAAPVSPTPVTEDELGSIIYSDQNLAGRISVYTEEIFGRNFYLHVPPGTTTAYFKSTDKKSKIPVDLVNDGFGINQIIYILAKLLRQDVRTLLIEEPEVHLHPTILRSFARSLCELVRDEHKQIVLTTHSDIFLGSLLTVIAEGNLKPDEIKCYLVTKEKKTSTFTEQRVQPNGQIDGGLASFVEAEYEDLKKFLGVK